MTPYRGFIAAEVIATLRKYGKREQQRHRFVLAGKPTHKPPKTAKNCPLTRRTALW